MTLSYHIDDIDEVAKSVLEQLESKVVLFQAEMGSGKTTFISALLKVMNSEDAVSSPTFSIINEYDIPNDKVYHMDCYRLKSIDEAYDIGIEDYLDNNYYVFIEWPEKIESLWPDVFDVISITSKNKTERTLKLSIKTNKLTENQCYDSKKVVI